MQQPGCDIEKLQREVKRRWLKPKEVLKILQNHHLFTVEHRTPQKPPSGSWFLFNCRVHRFFRNDGYEWRKKKSGKTIGEAHEYLKVDDVEALNCYYAHAENNNTFQRRMYWMLDPAYEHIVLVHYRDVLESSISVSALNDSSTSNQNGSASRADAHSSPGFSSEIIAALLNSCSPGSAKEVSSQILTLNDETNNTSRFDWVRTLEMKQSLENKERPDVNTEEVLPNHDPILAPGIQNEDSGTCANLADIFNEPESSEDNHNEGTNPYTNAIDFLKSSDTWLEEDQLESFLPSVPLILYENQLFNIHEVSSERAFCSESAKSSISVSALNDSSTSNQNGSASRADAHSSPGFSSEIIAALLNSCSPGSAKEVSSQILTLNDETNNTSRFDWVRTLEMKQSLENKERPDVNTEEVLPNHDPILAPGIQNEDSGTCANLADIFNEPESSEDNHNEGTNPYTNAIDFLKSSDTWLEEDQLESFLPSVPLILYENQLFNIHEVSPERAFCSESAKGSISVSVQNNSSTSNENDAWFEEDQLQMPFQSSASKDANAFERVAGASSTRYTTQPSPKDFSSSISVSALNDSSTSNQNGSASRADAHSSPGFSSEIIAALLNSCSPGSAKEVSSQILTLNDETNNTSRFDWVRTLEMKQSLENKERPDVNTEEVLPNHDPILAPGIQNEDSGTCANLADIFNEPESSEDNHNEGTNPYTNAIDFLKSSDTWLEEDQLESFLPSVPLILNENQLFNIHEVSPERAFCSESAKYTCDPYELKKLFMQIGTDAIHNEFKEFFTQTGTNPQHLPLQYLKDITDNFSEERILGRGGFGVVYKGVLQDGEMVAVKKLVQSMSSSEKQFENEVNILMELKHPNVVRLLGYCYETKRIHTRHEGKFVFAWNTESLLCLEYLPNGSLDKYISDASCGLDWHTRLRIIEGVSYGLQYLHEQSNGPIIHLDLKPANILLDKNMGAKITDFGVSRLIDQTQTICTINTSGTLGYMPPEYLRGIITLMSDIYSLGVIIMEVITGHRNYPYDLRTDSEGFIELEHKKWRSVLQKNPGYTSLEIDCQKIKRCIQVGLICVNPERTKRPTIKKVIDMLQGVESINWEKMVGGLAAGADACAVSDPTSEDPAAKRPAAIAFAYGFKGLSAFLSEAELTNTLHSLESKENGNPIDHTGAVGISSAVDRISDKYAHVDGGTDDQLALKDSLGAVRNAVQAAVQAAGRIHATFRVFSLEKKKEKALQNEDSCTVSVREAGATSRSMQEKAALSIQKNFRCWKKRKEFISVWKNVIKIQARVRAHQERNKYKELLQNVGILEKGVGLRGFNTRAMPDCELIKTRKKTSSGLPSSIQKEIPEPLTGKQLQQNMLFTPAPGEDMNLNQQVGTTDTSHQQECLNSLQHSPVDPLKAPHPHQVLQHNHHASCPLQLPSPKPFLKPSLKRPAPFTPLQLGPQAKRLAAALEDEDITNARSRPRRRPSGWDITGNARTGDCSRAVQGYTHHKPGASTWRRLHRPLDLDLGGNGRTARSPPVGILSLHGATSGRNSPARSTTEEEGERDSWALRTPSPTGSVASQDSCHGGFSRLPMAREYYMSMNFGDGDNQIRNARQIQGQVQPEVGDNATTQALQDDNVGESVDMDLDS